MGKGITYVPIDWNENSPTRFQEKSPRTISLDSDGNAQNRAAIKQEAVSDKKSMVSAMLENPEYKDFFNDMPDEKSKARYIMETLKGASPVDVARDIFEARARDREGAVETPDGSYLEIPVDSTPISGATKQELEMINDAIQNNAIEHQQRKLNEFNGGDNETFTR